MQKNGRRNFKVLDKTAHVLHCRQEERRNERMSFGEQLSSVRRRSGLTQEQFAEQLQVSRQAVSKWESGVSHS